MIGLMKIEHSTIQLWFKLLRRFYKNIQERFMNENYLDVNENIR